MSGRNIFRLALFLAHPLLAGCGSSSVSYGQYFDLLKQSFSRTAPGVTLEQAAGIPYASIGFRVDGSSQGLLVLATDTAREMMWTSALRMVLVTRDGRIIKSVGLPKDRTGLTPPQGQRLPAPAEAIKASYYSTRLVDMPGIGAYGMVLSCVTQARGVELVRILGTALQTVRVEEKCQGSSPRWTFTDTFWVDRDSGFVWRSDQNLYPGSVRVQTEILRPPE